MAKMKRSKNPKYNRKGPKCPKCGQPSRSKATQYGWRNECCGLRSWGDKPLEDSEDLKARKRAHLLFDLIWERKLMFRGQAYNWLAREMGMKSKDCHMEKMDAEQANRVAEIAKGYLLEHWDKI